MDLPLVCCAVMIRIGNLRKEGDAVLLDAMFDGEPGPPVVEIAIQRFENGYDAGVASYDSTEYPLQFGQLTALFRQAREFIRTRSVEIQALEPPVAADFPRASDARVLRLLREARHDAGPGNWMFSIADVSRIAGFPEWMAETTIHALEFNEHVKRATEDCWQLVED